MIHYAREKYKLEMRFDLWYGRRAMLSDRTKAGIQRAPHRSLMRATGMTDEDIKKPFIAICNSFNEVIPGHVHLNKVAELIKDEVRKAGGTPIVNNLCHTSLQLLYTLGS